MVEQNLCKATQVAFKHANKQPAIQTQPLFAQPSRS